MLTSFGVFISDYAKKQVRLLKTNIQLTLTRINGCLGNDVVFFVGRLHYTSLYMHIIVLHITLHHLELLYCIILYLHIIITFTYHYCIAYIIIHIPFIIEHKSSSTLTCCFLTANSSPEISATIFKDICDDDPNWNSTHILYIHTIIIYIYIYTHTRFSGLTQWIARLVFQEDDWLSWVVSKSLLRF